MKIEDHNKKLFFARMLARTGGSVKRRYSRHIPESARDHMAHKPYGGTYGKDKSDEAVTIS